MAKKILAIDDDKDILTILDIIFNEEGYDLVLMNTGATTEQIAVLHPDIILMDVRIEGFDRTGAEICAAIKAELAIAEIPVLLLSAEDRLGQLAEKCGADGYVSKPFDIDSLVSKVREFVT
ncbi:response regulator [Mucilaginibacter pedocola]|uniref:Histidine kinase n=1 Tax=Mucilaginibacter pedocola TaxID=1792845 RepID=A0A1S9P6L3_9SPHI|nr:response regulator [Mucilaginibacter pedocola]OOQ56594.1 histidine kinase [Mucilaginibacter pedocola]